MDRRCPYCCAEEEESCDCTITSDDISLTDSSDDFESDEEFESDSEEF